MTVSKEKQKESFGDWLRETRIAKGIGVRELAALSEGECSASYISYLERNVYSGKEGNSTRPSEAIVEALALGLEVPLHEARLAAGYASLSAAIGEESFIKAFASLYEGFEMLSTEGKEAAKREADLLIRSLMENEGLSFSDGRKAFENFALDSPRGLEGDEFTIDLSIPEPGVDSVDKEFRLMTDEELKNKK